MADNASFSIRLPVDLLKQIEKIAADNDKSRNLMIIRLLEHAVENFETDVRQEDDLRARVEALEKAVAELQSDKSK